MTWDTWVFVFLYAASAALPVWGLVGLYRPAVKDAKTYKNAPVAAGGEGTTFGQMNVLVGFLHRAQLGRPQAAIRDFVFIGLGVFFGAVASTRPVVQS